MTNLRDFFKAIGFILVILVSLYVGWILAILLVIISLIFIVYHVFSQHRKFKDSLKEGD